MEYLANYVFGGFGRHGGGISMVSIPLQQEHKINSFLKKVTFSSRLQIGKKYRLENSLQQVNLICTAAYILTPAISQNIRGELGS